MPQRLHLVFGGELIDPTKTAFTDVKNIDIVGIFPDYATAYEQFTMNGKISEPTDLVEFILENSFGIRDVSWEEFSKKGFIRVDDSDDVQFGKDSAFNYETLNSTRDKHPWQTLTGRQQFYLDQEWFLSEGEALPVYKGPLKNMDYDVRLTMGHALDRRITAALELAKIGFYRYRFDGTILDADQVTWRVAAIDAVPGQYGYGPAATF